MSPEASWQASSVERQGPKDGAADLNFENHSVEALLRRLITRVEESERRYGEALDELHARLDRLSKTTESVPALGGSEEAETLERLRSQLSGLAERLEHPEAPEPSYEGLAKLDKALSEAREATAGLGRETSPFAALKTAVPPPATSFSIPPGAGNASFSAPAIERPAVAIEQADLDRRLVDMAERLERSIGEAMPTAAIQSLNARMDEIARKFDEALRQTPKLENLRSLERQITDMGQQLGQIGEQASRISVVEGQLHRLIERADDTSFHIETTASKAANEAARLVAGSSFGAASAAERLEALHRDIVAMNERSRATDDRLVDTLAAMHDSLKGLIQQVERVRQTNQAQTAPIQKRKDRVAEPPAFQPAAGPSSPIPASPSVGEPAPKSRTAPVHDRSLRGRLREGGPEREEAEPLAAFGPSKRDFFADDAIDLDAGDVIPADAAFPTADPMMSGDDLVAAARRAAQAAAARAEGRTTRPAKGRAEESWATPTSGEMPERRKRSMLMVVAILLLLLSAGLLYSRLRSKPEAEAVPPSTEQSVTPPAVATPPAAEATPAPESAPMLETPPAAEAPTMPVTSPDTAPEAAPAPEEAEPAPQPQQMAPHSTTPSAEIGGTNVPPPVRVSEAPTVLVSASPRMARTVSDIAKSSAMPAAQQVALKSNDGLPGDVTMSVSEPGAGQAGTAAPDQGPGPAALRQAANDGDPRAQYILALLCSNATANAANPASPNWYEAARWLALAASAGLAPAQYRLAVLYERGDGVGKDLGRAKSWYLRAAELGNVKAMHNLAVVVSRQSGNPDYTLAAKWFGEAASYGLADSQFNLGVLAEHGLGQPKNPAEAYKWFSLAAASHDLGAIKHRDLVQAKLSAAERIAGDDAVRAWIAKPAKADANEVAEQASWRAEAASPDKAQIARAQTLLNRLGYHVGTADGEISGKTREAIKIFELRTGMDETGEVSGQLLTRLEGLAG